MAKRPWKRGVLASAVALTMLGASLDAQALALGAITVRSALGEPLRAEIEVPQISSQEAATFQAAVASPQAFRSAGVDYSPALSGARVTLHRRSNGQAYLRVAGDRPINEPFLGIVIDANWGGGRVVRDYTMLVDPPGRVAPPPVTVTQPQIAQPPVAPPGAVQEPAVAQAPTAVQTTPTPVPESATRARRPAAESPRVRATLAPAASGDGDRVTVQRGDTAYGLASTHAADGVSLDQMLLAMLRANPKAFIGGNVNRMRAGAVLNMPTAEQAAATPRQTARRAVVAQSRDFNAYRHGVASRSGSTRVASATRSTAGGVQPQVQEARPAAPSPDKLTLSRAGAPSGTESKVAQSRQAQEQSDRVAELNKNIKELSRLQAASGAAAARPAAPAASAAVPAINVPTGAPAAPVPVPAPTPAPPTVTPTVPASAAATAAAVVASAAANAASDAATAASDAATAAASAASSASAAAPAAVAAADSAASAAAVAASAAAPAPAKPRVVPAPAPVAEPSFLDSLTDNPLLLPGVGVLLAALAGLGFYRARQRKKETAPLDSSFIESRLQPDSFFGASGGQRVNTKEGGSSVSANSSMAYSPSQLDAAGDVDPVAEADVYLAYGRDMQAEEILKEALRSHPGRVAIHRKLAEIYAKRRDARAFEAMAIEAHGLTHGQGPDWLAITSLGSELDPSNQLYQPGGTPLARTAPAPVRATFGADTEPQTAQLIDPKVNPNAHAPLDLDLDLNDAPVRAPAAVPAPTPPAPTPSVVAPAVAAGAAAAATAAAARLSVAPPPPSDSELHAPLDFDLDLAFAPPSEQGTAKPPAAQAQRPAAAPVAPVVENNAGMIDFDMNALSVDPDSRSGGELKTEQPDDADEDPLGTKLSLAQEFHAIGDTEGARSLVKEVIAESSGALRVRAERFLAELH
ncbi:fimbrial protein FimV [Ottowia testudinis]|uniref:Fimbrial protein FimV n=2 Tax=Ottowia testudinis TaxID=2816950 RepID=A0A975H7S9_9BURK|nr:fimbrial protein FimV [Ottowia testudinis]